MTVYHWHFERQFQIVILDTLLRFKNRAPHGPNVGQISQFWTSLAKIWGEIDEMSESKRSSSIREWRSRWIFRLPISLLIPF